MLINAVNSVLVVFVVCNLSYGLSQSSRKTETERTQISTEKLHPRPVESEALYTGLKERQDLVDSKLFTAKDNIKKKVRKNESRKGHITGFLNGHHKGNAKEIHKHGTVERPKRKQRTKRKHHTKEGTRKVSRKTRKRIWDELISLVKGKKKHPSKNFDKLLNEAANDLKKDRKSKDKDNLKKNKKFKDKNNLKKNKNFNDKDNLKTKKRLPVTDKTKAEKANTGDKSVDNKSNKKKDSNEHRENGDNFADEKSNGRKDNNEFEHRENSDKDSSSLSKTKLESLRKALLVHPFTIWKFKDRFKSMADIGIHEALLHDVVENKWNTRLQHKLFKVFKGENIHLAIIGGSNTAGGGLQEDEGRTDGIFFRVISDWWRKTITPVTGSRLKTRQIAMGGTGSDFFQYCHRSYIQKNVDLVLLEMSVNDLHELPLNVNLSLPIEQLTRQLLDYPTEPALIYVNLLSGRAYYQGCTNLEDFGQRLLSDVYKVTTFSWRDAVCPVIGGKFRAPLRGCTVVCKDGHHINQLGHAHVSLMVINLFRDLLLDSIAKLDEMSRQVFHDEVILPKPVFIAEESKIITEPICWTTVTPNFKRKIITNSMEVGVMENYGFDFLHDKPIGGSCVAENACRADAYSGWTGQDVGASLTVSFTVPPLGHKREVKSRSVVLATRTCFKCGVAEVWLDDDVVNRRLIRAKSMYAQTLLNIIALQVNPGDHTLNVKVVYPGFFTVVGVMLGPPDGPY